MTCFKLVKAVVPVSLLPSRLRRPHEGVTAGVDEYLNTLLLTYMTQFEGVVISYRRVHINGEPLGCINGLYPCINFKVSAEFVVFAPKIHSQLVGKITKVGPDLVNLLVHGLFTVILDKSGIPEAYSFDADTGTWKTGVAARVPVVIPLEKKGGLSKTAKKKLLKEQAKAMEGKVKGDDPGGESSLPPLAPDVWLKFSILSLDLHGKVYQWKATARGEGLGVVPALTPLHEAAKAKDEALASGGAPESIVKGEKDGALEHKGRKKQRVS